MTDEAWIKQCEVLRLHLYTDTTGNPTIGWGRNLKKGISLDEAELMFQNDLKEVLSELGKLSWFLPLPANVKSAIVNMTFNIGIKGILGFHEMITALIEKNWTLAAQHALNSLWATQVGDRAKAVAVMIREAK